MTSVWTGSAMIVVNCGSTDDGLSIGVLGDQGGYDPATDSWTGPEPALNWCPLGGYEAVWTGTEMLLWGRVPAAFNPTSDELRYLSDVGAPYVPADGTICPAVWTGSRLLVWGASCNITSDRTGAQYDLATDTWCPMTTMDAPMPSDTHPVWAGDRMVIWGGPGTDFAGRYFP